MGIGSRMVGRGDNWWSGACDSDKYLEKKRGAKFESIAARVSRHSRTRQTVREGFCATTESPCRTLADLS